MEKHILITGAAGILGKEMTKMLLANTDTIVYGLLHKSQVNTQTNDFLNSLQLSTEQSKRLVVIEGNITDHEISSKLKQANLLQNLTGIIHAAAITRFDLPYRDIYPANVLGTSNMLHFANKCQNLEKFAYISTAYVSGKRIGTITEQELEHTSGFVNSYEQSKYEAEKLVKAASDNIPVCSYRLSTIVGSTNGTVSHFTAPHQALRIMYLGLASMIPGTPTYSVNLIPSDYILKTWYTLFCHHFIPNMTYQLTSPSSKCFTLEELINESFVALAKYDPSWKEKKFPKPAIANKETFDLFIQAANDAGNVMVAQVLKALSHFSHQLNYDKNFTYSNVLRVVPSYEIEFPDIRDYYFKIVEYCINTKWGKVNDSKKIN